MYLGGRISRLFIGVAVIVGIISMGVFALNHPVSAVAGINDHLNFQGRLYNSQGAIVPDGNYNLQFKIYQDGAGTAAGNPGGTLKWTENWLNSGSNGISIRNGYLSKRSILTGIGSVYSSKWRPQKQPQQESAAGAPTGAVVSLVHVRDARLSGDDGQRIAQNGEPGPLREIGRVAPRRSTVAGVEESHEIAVFDRAAGVGIGDRRAVGDDSPGERECVAPRQAGGIGGGRRPAARVVKVGAPARRGAAKHQ